MNLIQNNPFRILGLPITASEREIAKQINTLATYAEMGKTKTFDTDFSFFPTLERTPHVIEEAKKQIEQSENKLLNSFFWFWKNSSVDELAFDLLKEGKIDKAISIWEKAIFANQKISFVPQVFYQSINKAFNSSDNESYQIENKASGIFFTKKTAGSFWSAREYKLDQSTNFSIECETEWIEGAENNSYCLIWGKAPEKGDFYSFGISANGYMIIDKFIDWTSQNLMGWAEENSINERGHNKLSIEKISKKYYFYINDSLIYTLPFEPFFGDYIGFRINSNMKVRFFNYNINHLVPNSEYANGVDITSKNFSSIKNLSTLYLSLATNNGTLQLDYFKKGISLANKFFSSKEITTYGQQIAGSNYIYNHATSLPFYINDIIESIKKYLDKPNGISIAQLINSFSIYPLEGKQFVNNKFISKHIQSIEREIEEAQAARNLYVNTSVTVGTNLMSKTSLDIRFLKSVLGESELQYQMIADKLALEISRCGVDYFNATKDDEPCLPLYQYAVDIAVGDRAKEKTKENLDSCVEWISGKFVREKRKRTGDAFDYIVSQLDATLLLLGSKDPSIEKSLQAQAQILITNTKPKLSHIKEILGFADPEYIEISSNVASIAIACIVEYVNATSSLRGIEHSSVLILNTIGGLTMNTETKTRYNSNKSTLDNMYSRSNTYSRPAQKTNTGCYIATMVYGSYEARQVLILRQFRDDVLENSSLGRNFIKFYYKYSPSFVKRFQHNITVNKTIKYILDTFIKLLPK